MTTASPSNMVMGVDLANLASEQPAQLPIPEQVPNRVVHVDADFLAYQVCYDDAKPLEDMIHNCDERIKKIKALAGAEFVKLHLTPKGSTKGDRAEVALLKEYQATRQGRVKPRWLNNIREWMHKERKATMHFDLEADDGMSIAQYTAINKGEVNLSVIATKDKDLLMVPGLLLDWDTGVITDTKDDPFGYIYLDDTGSQKKVRGRGWKYFWIQMLMGDPADNVSGLPMLCTTRYIKGKPKKCGTVNAFNIINPTKTNREAFELVRELYKDAGKAKLLTNWRDGTEVDFGLALQSEAQLLWMRRENSINDAIKWMKETCI